MSGRADGEYQRQRANLTETIERQRFGFRTLGSPFYDRLGDELATTILEDGPVWDALAPFAGAPFEDAYVLRFFAGIHMRVLDGSSSTLAAHFPSTGGDGRRMGPWAPSPSCWMRPRTQYKVLSPSRPRPMRSVGHPRWHQGSSSSPAKPGCRSVFVRSDRAVA